MKLLIALTLVGSAFAQADPETLFNTIEGEPSKFIGLTTKGDLGALPIDCESISPNQGLPYCDLEMGTADLAPDGTVTILGFDDDGDGFFGLFIGVEIGATGGFEGGVAVDVTGFGETDPFTLDVAQFPPIMKYAPDGRLWTADYSACLDGDVFQFPWGTLDLEADPVVFTAHFEVTSLSFADGGFFDLTADPEFVCPFVGAGVAEIANDWGFGILGNYLYLNYALDFAGYGFWAISLDTVGVYTRTLDNMIWALWVTGIGLGNLPGGGTDRGQGNFFVGTPVELSIGDAFALYIQRYDFSCYPPAIVQWDPTPITWTPNDEDDGPFWALPVSAGREFYYCDWPEGVCADGAINEHFVVIGDGLVESVCASVPTGECGYTWIGCEDGYVAHGFIPGKETCNRTASEIGWSTNYWGASEFEFECEFGAGGSTTECKPKCTVVAQSVNYRGTELQFEVSCYRCDDPTVALATVRDERFTRVTDNTGFGAIVVAVGCAVGDLDCCNFVLSRAQCESGVDLDLCFCGIDIIDCPNPNCNRSKKGLLGLLGLLGIIPLALCCLLLLLCFLRGKKRGAPVPVATFDACAPPVFDGGFGCTAVPSLGNCGPSLGFPGTFVA